MNDPDTTKLASSKTLATKKSKREVKKQPAIETLMESAVRRSKRNIKEQFATKKPIESDVEELARLDISNADSSEGDSSNEESLEEDCPRCGRL